MQDHFLLLQPCHISLGCGEENLRVSLLVPFAVDGDVDLIFITPFVTSGASLRLFDDANMPYPDGAVEAAVRIRAENGADKRYFRDVALVLHLDGAIFQFLFVESKLQNYIIPPVSLV